MQLQGFRTRTSTPSCSLRIYWFGVRKEATLKNLYHNLEPILLRLEFLDIIPSCIHRKECDQLFIITGWSNTVDISNIMHPFSTLRCYMNDYRRCCDRCDTKLSMQSTIEYVYVEWTKPPVTTPESIGKDETIVQPRIMFLVQPQTRFGPTDNYYYIRKDSSPTITIYIETRT